MIKNFKLKNKLPRNKLRGILSAEGGSKSFFSAPHPRLAGYSAAQNKNWSRSGLKNKTYSVQNLLLYLFILLLPTQLGYHFWPQWSFVNGLRIDYLAPTLYLTDLLGILIVFLSFLNFLSDSNNLRALNRIALLCLTAFLVFNLFFSRNQPETLYRAFRLVGLMLLVFSVRDNLHRSKTPLSAIIFLLSLTVIYEAVLAVWQFVNQSSVGGLWWLLGERTFNLGTPGIAKTLFLGKEVLRSYGTFSHPNIFAGYLAVLLPLFIGQIKKGQSQIYYSLITIISLITLILTFSKTAIMTAGLIGILGLLTRFKSSPFSKVSQYQKHAEKIKYLPLFYILLLFLIFTFYFLISKNPINISDFSFTRRYELNIAALKMFLAHPLTGVGLGSFVSVLPNYYASREWTRFLQPAHNIYLLWLSETGIVGGIFLIIILRRFKSSIFHLLSSRSNFYLLSSIVSIVFLGLFDHYFYTQQQGNLLLVLIFALIAQPPLSRQASDTFGG